MPTYDLTCEDCGARFERFFGRMLCEDDRVCPVCGSTRVKTGVGGGVVRASRAEGRAPCEPRGGFA